MASKVERTQPGSKNDWRITYDTGSQKWTDDRPGDGVGKARGDLLQAELREPAVQRGLTAVNDAIQDDGDVKQAIDDMVRDTGKERAKTVLNAVYRAAKEANAPNVADWDKVRQMVAYRAVGGIKIEAVKARSLRQVNQYLWKHGMPKDIELNKGKGFFYLSGGDAARWPESSIAVFSLGQLSLDEWLKRYQELAKKAPARRDKDDTDDVIVLRRRGGRLVDANIRDVVDKIFRKFKPDKAKEIAQRVVDFWKTKNKKKDLTPQEQRRLYRDVDYGEVLPLTKKRKVDVDWTDHAEYRSELRDIDPEQINETVRDRLRQRLNPPQSKKMKFKEPGVGTMVVDFSTKSKPADADVITVWGSEKQRRVTAAVMDRVDPEQLATLWYENKHGDKFYPDLSGETEPETPPKSYDYQVSRFSDLRENVLKTITPEDVAKCDHPAEYRRKDHGMDPSYGEGEKCDKCGGYREKPAGKNWSNWKSGGSRDVMVVNMGWSEDLVKAMSDSGISLRKAILLAATACERCMNALAHEFGLNWGYPEFSDEWHKCNTSCEYCEGIDEKTARSVLAAAKDDPMNNIAEELLAIATELDSRSRNAKPQVFNGLTDEEAELVRQRISEIGTAYMKLYDLYGELRALKDKSAASKRLMGDLKSAMRDLSIFV